MAPTPEEWLAAALYDTYRQTAPQIAKACLGAEIAVKPWSELRQRQKAVFIKFAKKHVDMWKVIHATAESKKKRKQAKE